MLGLRCKIPNHDTAVRIREHRACAEVTNNCRGASYFPEGVVPVCPVVKVTPTIRQSIYIGRSVQFKGDRHLWLRQQRSRHRLNSRICSPHAAVTSHSLAL